MTMPTTAQFEKDVKDRYMTIRIPFDVEQELRRIADKNTRTLAAQVLHYIKQGIVNEKMHTL